MVLDGSQLGQPYDYLLKVIVVGESGTGKSCLLHHFIHGSVKENATHTIGVEFASRILRVGEKDLKLQLWDTAGQERFRSVTRSYYRGASACLLVYDITRRATFEPLSQWLEDARALASPDLFAIVVGNKLDKQSQREVSYEEAFEWSKEKNVLYIETSSISQGENIEKPFSLICNEILKAIQKGKLNPEKPGSGISYGDRGLRSVVAGSSSSNNSSSNGKGGRNSKFTFTEVMPNGNRSSGAITLQSVKHSFDGCC